MEPEVQKKDKKPKDRGEKQQKTYGIASYATSCLPTTSYSYGGGGFSNYSASNYSLSNLLGSNYSTATGQLSEASSNYSNYSTVHTDGKLSDSATAYSNYSTAHTDGSKLSDSATNYSGGAGNYSTGGGDGGTSYNSYSSSYNRSASDDEDSYTGSSDECSGSESEEVLPSESLEVKSNHVIEDGRVVESGMLYLPSDIVNVAGRKWNQTFQDLYGVLCLGETEEQLVLAFSDISYMYIDFIRSAKLYGKEIIQERWIDNASKTIKSLDVGGIAGGDKYLADNIFFKFNLDHFLIYGGSRNAAKASFHELRNYNLLAESFNPNLRFPLFVNLDYIGYQVSCMCLLPVNKNSLIYGSADGGKTVKMDATISKEIDKISSSLNLCAHLAGEGPTPPSLTFPCDIEGHVGSDGRYYILDNARIMPPEPPSGNFLCRLMRHEFVRQYSKPLCSDAYSNFVSRKDIKRVTYAQDCNDAYMKLITDVIPKFVDKLQLPADICISFYNEYNHASMTPASSVHKITRVDPIDERDKVDLKHLMHESGINMRHLGKLYVLLDSKYWKKRVFDEMVQRTSYAILQALLTLSLEKFKSMKNDHIMVVLTEYLNLLLGKSEKSRAFYNYELKKSILKTYYYDQTGDAHLPEDIYELVTRKELCKKILPRAAYTNAYGKEVDTTMVQPFSLPTASYDPNALTTPIAAFKENIKHIAMMPHAELFSKHLRCQKSSREYNDFFWFFYNSYQTAPLVIYMSLFVYAKTLHKYLTTFDSNQTFPFFHMRLHKHMNLHNMILRFLRHKESHQVEDRFKGGVKAVILTLIECQKLLLRAPVLTNVPTQNFFELILLNSYLYKIESDDKVKASIKALITHYIRYVYLPMLWPENEKHLKVFRVNKIKEITLELGVFSDDSVFENPRHLFDLRIPRDNAVHGAGHHLALDCIPRQGHANCLQCKKSLADDFTWFTCCVCSEALCSGCWSATTPISENKQLDLPLPVYELDERMFFVSSESGLWEEGKISEITTAKQAGLGQVYHFKSMESTLTVRTAYVTHNFNQILLRKTIDFLSVRPVVKATVGQEVCYSSHTVDDDPTDLAIAEISSSGLKLKHTKHNYNIDCHSLFELAYRCCRSDPLLPAHKIENYDDGDLVEGGKYTYRPEGRKPIECKIVKKTAYVALIEIQLNDADSYLLEQDLFQHYLEKLAGPKKERGPNDYEVGDEVDYVVSPTQRYPGIVQRVDGKTIHTDINFGYSSQVIPINIEYMGYMLQRK